MVNVTQHKTEERALISLNFRNLQVKTNHKSNLKIQSHYEKALIKRNEDLGEKKKKRKGQNESTAESYLPAALRHRAALLQMNSRCQAPTSLQ